MRPVKQNTTNRDSISGRLAPFDEILAEFVDQLKQQHSYLTQQKRFRWKPLESVFQKALDSSSNISSKNGVTSWLPQLNSDLSMQLNSIVHNFNSHSKDEQTAVPLSMRMALSDVCTHILQTQLITQTFLLDTTTSSSANGNSSSSNQSVPRHAHRQASELLSLSDIPRIQALIQDVADDVGALAREKFGVAPAVTINNKSATTNIDGSKYVVDSLLRFAITELLKNSMKSTVNKYGALNSEDAPAIEIVVENSVSSSSSTSLEIRIVDYGEGVPENIQSLIMMENRDARYSTFSSADGCSSFQPKQSSVLFTSHVVNSKDINYHYSRAFGTPFSGVSCFP